MNPVAFSGAETGGYGATRAHRLVRRALLSLVAVTLAGALTGCATKADIRNVREDLTRLEARQDSIFQLLQSQNREILDSLTLTTERLLNVRGQLANQLSELGDQLVQVSELTNQVQIRLNRLDQELAEAIRAIATSSAGGGGSGADDPGGDPGDGDTFDEAQELYDAGLEQVNRGNSGTARRAFQMVVESFPDHRTAPEAQRQIAETYYAEGQHSQALEAFERVVERYQDSDAAPRALYRAGVIAREIGQTEQAREYFRRVISAYPNSDARGLAEDALERMG